MDLSVSLNGIIESWPEDQKSLRDIFLSLARSITEPAGVRWEIVSRSGISHSLRANVLDPDQIRKRSVYTVLDVVCPVEGDWFLSLCFYNDEVSDPEELGNPVPRGLYDEDARCFDLGTDDLWMADYLRDRVAEALEAAGRPSSV